VKWLPDPTGRFSQRPYYEGMELDRECEKIIVEFLLDRHDRVAYPVATNDLCVLVEQSAADFDEWADLSGDGPDVQGKTVFSRRGKPNVYISGDLQEPYRENRRRTTLTHELAHARLHNYLVVFDVAPPPVCCTAGSLIGASVVDWLEWQAGYASGAFLMPLSPLQRVVREARRAARLPGAAPIALTDPAAPELLKRVQGAFQVSADAARVRLLQLSILVG
jgi:Zn-dependent peptidase ImmA (M78 family)